MCISVLLLTIYFTYLYGIVIGLEFVSMGYSFPSEIVLEVLLDVSRDYAQLRVDTPSFPLY